MWMIITLACSLAGLVLVLRQLPSLPDFPTRCLLLALWLRYALQAFPAYTVQMGVAGFSVVALFAIAAAGLLIATSDHVLIRIRYLAPLYAFFAVVIISSVINQSFSGLARDFMKWIYFIGMLLLAYRAIILFGLQRIMRAFIWTMATPLLLQAFSVALNAPKVGPDGSLSYIGGYFHEGLFSTILFSFICVASLIRWRQRWVGTFLIAVGIVGIFLANYRTSIIATLPMLMLAVFTGGLSLWPKTMRPAVAATLFVAALLAAPALWDAVPERYADVVHVVNDIEILAKEPYEFTAEERRVFSGRTFIWSQYIQAYLDGDYLTAIIGFGSSSYEGRFALYAHNTFVSYLYEFGVVGLILILYVLLYNLSLTFNIDDGPTRWRLAAAHLGFIILNLATMPLWSTEGMTIYALLLAACWAVQPPSVRGPRRRLSQPWLVSTPSAG